MDVNFIKIELISKKRADMKICFSADQIYLSSLQTDVLELKQSLELPCEIEDIYRHLPKLRENAIAGTFYGNEEIEQKSPVIEFSNRYFTCSKTRKKIVILHEIIHAYQRSGSLSQLNSKFLVDALRQYKPEIKEELKLQIDTKYKKFQIKKKPMLFASTLIFEIWEDIFMKENYPDLFEEAMDFVYENISTDLVHKNPFQEFGNDAKYYIFLCMVRALYLSKISKNTNSLTKFEFLYEKWREELDKRFVKKELDFVNEFIVRLTNVESPLELEKSYSDFLDHVWRN